MVRPLPSSPRAASSSSLGRSSSSRSSAPRRRIHPGLGQDVPHGAGRHPIAQADQFTTYLSWLGILVGAGAVFLGVVAVQALRQNVAARKLAESQAERAQTLEQAVRERTQELWEANQALKAEAEERHAAEAQGA